MLPITWLNRISTLIISDVRFSVCGLQCGDRRLWRSETWERSCISPYPPSIPTKTHRASMCPQIDPAGTPVFFFKIKFVVQWNNSPFQWGETQKTSAQNCKNYLENAVWKNMDCISPSERFQSHIYLNDWVNPTIITADLRRVFKRKR